MKTTKRRGLMGKSALSGMGKGCLSRMTGRHKLKVKSTGLFRANKKLKLKACTGLRVKHPLRV